MSTNPPTIPEREERLQDVILANLKAKDAGATPDRQALLAEHADLRSELSAFFADEDGLPALVAPFHAAAAPLRPATVPRVFGDCEMLEGTARGGMEVVDRAQQRSLNGEAL
jgi:hypothetical protein